ncbi:MAG: YbhB/YbcL family Raf kinase inhibitor-like protein [Candidatus Omnitrophica bacterium]|nr:YbhB/YbcL family Raf kinase inhibitor-like protein [Candidatus Omnitrophota bacterium]
MEKSRFFTLSLITLFLCLSIMFVSNVQAFEVFSKDFKDGEMLPENSGYGTGNISPEISWINVPLGSKSLVLIVSDPDAPNNDFVHWLIYNIPGQVSSIPANAPVVFFNDKSIKQGVNDFNDQRYSGPWPPTGSLHRYFFTLFALDIFINASQGLKKEQLRKKLKGHVIGETQIMGTFKRQDQ